MLMRLKRLWANLAVCGVVVILLCAKGVTQQNSGASQSTSPQTSAEPDGQHDFDFEIGSWNIHLKRRLHPLTGSNTWVEFDGTSVTRKIWDGRSQIEEFETTGVGGRVEGLTLRLYRPEAHQWYLYWANGKDGILGQPMIGEFKNGVGEFYDQEEFTAEPSSSASSGQKRIPTSRTLNSRSRMMAARLGKSTGSRIRRGRRLHRTKPIELRGMVRQLRRGNGDGNGSSRS